MADLAMPIKWMAAQKLFPHQVGFSCPLVDDDAAPSDFLRMSLETVGVHGWLLHVPVYAHGLDGWQGTATFLREAGIDVLWAGNFVDQGWFADPEAVNDNRRILDGDLFGKSLEYVAA